MSTKKSWFAGFLLVLLNLCSFAQQDKWDLRRCVEYAINNNISIKQADIDARTAKLSYEQTRWSQFGQANLSTNLGFNFGRSVNPTTNLFSINPSTRESA